MQFMTQKNGLDYEQVIKRYSNIDPSYNANSQYDQFYMGKIFYNPKEVNKDNVKIYLMNKETNEDAEIQAHGDKAERKARKDRGHQGRQDKHRVGRADSFIRIHAVHTG